MHFFPHWSLPFFQSVSVAHCLGQHNPEVFLFLIYMSCRYAVTTSGLCAVGLLMLSELQLLVWCFKESCFIALRKFGQHFIVSRSKYKFLRLIKPYTNALHRDSLKYSLRFIKPFLCVRDAAIRMFLAVTVLCEVWSTNSNSDGVFLWTRKHRD